MHLHGVIKNLLEERYEKLDVMVECNPNKNVLEERTIEIFVYKSID
jgi:hypothetical protein